jgi:ATP-dependent helicase/nuclease subunit A
MIVNIKRYAERSTEYNREKTMVTEKEKLVLTNEQQKAAYCVNNAVVAAGAGSGKTMVLASRFVWLVTEKKCHVREILTLTFTRKAAAQMYRRIHLMLAETAAKETGEKGRLAKQALDEFTQARIQTLDSYCASIVRQAANRYGVNPHFVIDEERCRQLAINEALPFLISRREDPAITRLYPHKSPISIAHDIFAQALINFTHVDSPVSLHQDLKRQFAVVSAEWERQSGRICAKLHGLVDAYGENDKCHPQLGEVLTRFIEGRIIFPSGEELQDFFRQLTDLAHNTAPEWAENHVMYIKVFNVLEMLSSVYGLNLSKGSPRNNQAKEIIKELKSLYGEFSSLAVFCMQAGLIYSLLAHIGELQKHYVNKKRSEGVLTYGDVARLAKKILLEQIDIRQSEKESFKAIMIDEFQDNNELQKDLLFLLAEKHEITHNKVPPSNDLSEGKLFFVGDEKQSIYRFRGADVSVFRALKEELGSEDLPLKTNYRSAPLLIGAFNAIFGGSKFDIMGESPLSQGPAVFAPPSEDGVPSFDGTGSFPAYEASYTSLRADKKTKGKLTLCILDKKDADNEDDSGGESNLLDPVENEARFTAERINALLREKDDSGKQKYQPHDIAILFRSRSPQYLFEKHLMLLNIPYASEDLNGFFYGGPVNDLMSVLRLAVYPHDRAAYAQILRSPFAGLSISGLTACLNQNDASPNPFGEETLSLLNEEDKKKYAYGREIFKKINGSTCTKNICSLINELWYGEGYRYETEWNPQTAAYREMYDYLFHLAAMADEKNQTLAAFVDEIQELDKSGERLSDIEIPLERPGAVRLMTIHKSKGLEFPVVFLCCCNKQDRNNASDDIFDTVETGITMTPPLPPSCMKFKDIRRSYFWERSLALERGRRTAELRRLLYVAMTRARDELYLTGCLGITKNSGTDDGLPDSTDDFSLQCKRFIEQKIEKAEGKNTIMGDTVLDGVTFFGLCLPAFNTHIPQEGLKKTESFFSIEKIPLYSEQYMHKAERLGSVFPNDQKGLYSFFKKAESFYRYAQVITTPNVVKKYFSPTSLINDGSKAILPGSFAVNREYSGIHATDIFNRVDTLLEHYAQKNEDASEKFNSGSFGTIAHICAGALLSGDEPSIPTNMAGSLTPTDADAFLSAGKEIALRFINSPLGIIASESDIKRSEFPFRSLIYADEKEYFINGTIDLVFEEQRKVHVVDFKTDGQEVPGDHIPQMACYYRAAYDLFAVPAGKECVIWLYYLRSGHAIDVTEQAKNFDIGRHLLE